MEEHLREGGIDPAILEGDPNNYARNPPGFGGMSIGDLLTGGTFVRLPAADPIEPGDPVYMTDDGRLRSAIRRRATVVGAEVTCAACGRTMQATIGPNECECGARFNFSVEQEAPDQTDPSP